MKPKKRRLAAIMFTDIVGYSAMMQKDEEIASQLRDRHREVFTRLTEQYEGKILQYFGDGTLSIFPSSTAAVECAVAIQQELKRPPHVPIRIGIHSGDITYNEEEAYGDGVNVASRIESLCIPGGVYISSKVYDDIKNHPRLSARPVGDFELKNIRHKTDVFALTNSGLTVPDYTLDESLHAAAPAPAPQKRSRPAPKEGRKKKWAAGLLALFLGIFGIHRFYLGQRQLGILYLAFFLAGITFWNQLVSIVAIVAFIDAMIFFFQPRKAFDERYNEPQEAPATAAKTLKPDDELLRQKRFLRGRYNQHWHKAREEFREMEYAEAIDHLTQAIEIKYDSPEAHLLLARCYSLTEQAEKGFAHLDAAVAFGLRNPERIQTLDDLAFLRVQPEYDDFVKNGYRVIREKPDLPAEDILHLEEAKDPDLLEQLNQLQELLARGILTEEEFLQQKERLNL